MGSARTRRLGAAGAIAIAAMCLTASAQARSIGVPYIQAHRGGSIVNGKPAYPENTMPAFRHSAKRGFVLEMDAKLTKDSVPVIMHDATLDRTTNCTGLVADKTLRQLKKCRVDILGTEGHSVQISPRSPRAAGIPTLAHVLDFIRKHRAAASIEIKNVPTDPDFDKTDHFATVVSRAIKASRVPQSHLIIQSFWPPNLTVAKGILPLADLSFLTTSAGNGAGPAVAKSLGAQWVSPQWPVDAAYVADAHTQGREIVPYTIDKRADLVGAAREGVDAVITNDPIHARRVLHRTAPKAPPIPKAPTKHQCRPTRARLHTGPIRNLDARKGGPRVFAMQFKQEIGNVTTYGAFRKKIECMIREYVVPHLARHRPNVVAFNEDVGLMTLGTGSRGAVARKTIGNPGGVPSCEGKPAPCVAALALGQITAAYAPQVAAYRARFPDMGGLAQSFVAPTDTFARGWMQTFSDMARRYGIYIVGSNTQSPFRESRDPSEIQTFRDPDITAPRSVYVATDPQVYNEVFMWGPHTVNPEGPLPLRNVVTSNRKVPVTPFEEQLQVSNGPDSGPDGRANLRPFHLPRTRARIGFATSLPAFQFGYDFPARPPKGVKPCSDIATYYMLCLSKLGTNIVIQDEANDGRWAGTGGQGAWQPLEWMGSSWRDAVDRHVGIKYNVTPFMVGNLADLVFDGQSSIVRSHQGLRKCNYIGNRHLMPGPPENDPRKFRYYAHPHSQFMALAPWVVPGSSDRDRLRAVAGKLAPGSGSRLENDYLETALIADLTLKPSARKQPSCRRGERVDITKQGK